MSISHRYRCIFIHIPKTAGGTIKKIIDFEDQLVPCHSSIQMMYDNKRLSNRMIEEYWKFTFVRNPWDRLVSLFFHIKMDPYPGDPKLSVFDRESIKWISSSPRGKSQSSHLKLNGVIDVDYIGRFETLIKDWNYICDRLQMNFLFKIMIKTIHVNHGTKRPKINYRKFYNRETRRLAYRLYEEDIDRFQYNF